MRRLLTVDDGPKTTDSLKRFGGTAARPPARAEQSAFSKAPLDFEHDGLR
jgi:hypothetical protein